MAWMPPAEGIQCAEVMLLKRARKERTCMSGPPYCLVVHSPSALIPVLSISKSITPVLGR
jgi:hypothetical protein